MNDITKSTVTSRFVFVYTRLVLSFSGLQYIGELNGIVLLASCSQPPICGA